MPVLGQCLLRRNRRDTDVAIRATRKSPNTSLGRKICDFRFGIYASTEYLKQNSERPIQEQNWYLIQGVVDWLVPLIWKKRPSAMPTADK